MKFIDLKHLTLNNNYLHGSIPELPAESQLVILALHRNWVVVWFLLFYFHPYLLGFQKNQIQQFDELKRGEKTPRKPVDWNYHWILTTTSTVGCAHLAWPFELQKFREGSNLPGPKISSKWRVCLGFPTKNEIIWYGVGGRSKIFGTCFFKVFLSRMCDKPACPEVTVASVWIFEFQDAPQHVRRTHFIVCLPNFCFPLWKLRLLPGFAMNVRFFGGVFKHHPKKEQTPMVSSTCKGGHIRTHMAPETGRKRRFPIRV